MAYLFKVEDKVVKPTDEVLQVSPFKEIWERDVSPNKEVALQEFTYIEFMTSALKTNPYRGYSEDRKAAVIIKDVIHVENWQPDVLVYKGMEKVKEFQKDGSESYSLYLSAIVAKNKLQDFFNTFNMNKVNMKTGAPIYKPKDITAALQDLDKTIISLQSLEKKVEEDLFEAARIKGQKEVSVFADTSIINSLTRN